MSYPNLTHVYDNNGRHRISWHAEDTEDIAIVIGPRTDPWFQYVSPAVLTYNGVQYIAFTQYHYPTRDQASEYARSVYRGPYADVIYVLTEKE